MSHIATVQELRIKRHVSPTKSLAKVLGWDLIVRSEWFRRSKTCIFIEPGCKVPNTDLFIELQDKNWLTGFSTYHTMLTGGYAVPISEVELKKKVSIGQDVAKEIGITKRYKKNDLKVIGQLPDDIQLPFEHHIQSIAEVLAYNSSWTVTEKLNGVPILFQLEQDKLITYSRNGIINDTRIQSLAVAHDIKNKLQILNSKYYNYTLYAEWYKDKLYFFDMWNSFSGRYIAYRAFLDYMKELALPTVPILYKDFSTGHFKTPDVIRKAYMGIDIEGLVFRCKSEYSNSRFRKMSFKVVNPNYIFKKELFPCATKPVETKIPNVISVETNTTSIQ